MLDEWKHDEIRDEQEHDETPQECASATDRRVNARKKGHGEDKQEHEDSPDACGHQRRDAKYLASPWLPHDETTASNHESQGEKRRGYVDVEGSGRKAAKYSKSQNGAEQDVTRAPDTLRFIGHQNCP